MTAAALILASWVAVGGVCVALGARLESRTNHMNAQIHRPVIDLTESERDRLICNEIERAAQLV